MLVRLFFIIIGSGFGYRFRGRHGAGVALPVEQGHQGDLHFGIGAGRVQPRHAELDGAAEQDP